MNNSMRPSNSTLVGVAVAILIGAGAGTYVNHVRSFSEVHIVLPAGEKAIIYPDLGGDGPFNYSPSDEPAGRLQGSGTVTLKWGTYNAVIVDTNKKYEVPVKKFVVNKPSTSVVVSPDYTEETLAKILPTERKLAQSFAQQKLNIAARGYSFGPDALYGAGEWYGVVLNPRSPNQDTLRIILQKEKSSWRIAAQPAIIIGAPAHKDIPFTVVRKVNEL